MFVCFFRRLIYFSTVCISICIVANFRALSKHFVNHNNIIPSWNQSYISLYFKGKFIRTHKKWNKGENSIFANIFSPREAHIPPRKKSYWNFQYFDFIWWVYIHSVDMCDFENFQWSYEHPLMTECFCSHFLNNFVLNFIYRTLCFGRN